MAVQMLLRPFAGMAARGGISSLLGQVPKGVKLDVKTNQKKFQKTLKDTKAYFLEFLTKD